MYDSFNRQYNGSVLSAVSMQHVGWYSPTCIWCVGYVCICGSEDLEGDDVNSSHCCVFVKTGTSALWSDAWWEWCRCMARSQSLREKRASWNVISSYVIGATGRLLLSRGLLSTGGFDMQTSSQLKQTSHLFTGVGGVLSLRERQVNEVHTPACQPWSKLHPQYESYKQDHPTAFKAGIIIFSKSLLFVSFKGTFTKQLKGNSTN